MNMFDDHLNFNSYFSKLEVKYFYLMTAMKQETSPIALSYFANHGQRLFIHFNSLHMNSKLKLISVKAFSLMTDYKWDVSEYLTCIMSFGP